MQPSALALRQQYGRFIHPDHINGSWLWDIFQIVRTNGVGHPDNDTAILAHIIMFDLYYKYCVFEEIGLGFLIGTDNSIHVGNNIVQPLTMDEIILALDNCDSNSRLLKITR